MNKHEWLEAAIGEDTVSEMALKAGMSKATAFRQFNNDLNFTAENVILIARAYHKDPVEALVAFDYLRDDERGTASLRAALKNATNDDLLTEIASRLDRDPSLGDKDLRVELVDPPSDATDSLDSSAVGKRVASLPAPPVNAPDVSVLVDAIAAHPDAYGVAANRDPYKELEMETPRD